MLWSNALWTKARLPSRLSAMPLGPAPTLGCARTELPVVLKSPSRRAVGKMDRLLDSLFATKSQAPVGSTTAAEGPCTGTSEILVDSVLGGKSFASELANEEQ